MADYAMTIDGNPVGGTEFEVVNPATGRVVARAPACTTEQLDRAVAAAGKAFPIWSRTDDVRRAVLREAAETVLGSVAQLARLVTAEQGKTRAEAVAEVRAAGRWLRHYAGLDVPREVLRSRHTVTEVLHRPLGVVAAIPARNYPVALALAGIAPALRAGNTVVLKPSPYTPLATLELGRLLGEVLPPGVLNVVSGPEPLGAQLVTHRIPCAISFTGTTATGRWVASAAGTGLKRVRLDLGGNDAAIVLDDADPDAIADALFWAAFANSGQRCRAVKRLYVHRSGYQAMVDALAARAREVRVGNGSQRTTQLGPVGTRRQLDRIADLVGDAVARGAKAVAGGAPLRRPGFFYAPTVLAGACDGMPVVDEEQFGPVLPVIGYRDLDEAVRRANGTGYRLSASVWSPDEDRAAAVAARLEAGLVSVNDHAGAPRPDLPPAGAGLSVFSEAQLLSRPARNGEGAPAAD